MLRTTESGCKLSQRRKEGRKEGAPQVETQEAGATRSRFLSPHHNSRSPFSAHSTPQQVPIPLQLPLWRHAKPGKHGVDLPKYKLTNTNLPKINVPPQYQSLAVQQASRSACLRLRGQSVVAPFLTGAVSEAVATLTKDTLAQEQFNTGMREKQLSGALEWPTSQCELSPQATG
ncbi:unnamed protein product [Fusarium graminearum]|nr:unnamed protein product [Fusarium graminearum]